MGKADFMRAFNKLSPERQAKLTAFLQMLACENLAAVAVNSGMRLDWTKVGERVAIAAKALDLRESEVKAALAHRGRRAGPIVAFAKLYHQDLNWLLMGDVASMCHKLAWAGGWRPSWWDAGMEAVRYPDKAKAPAPRKARA